MTGGVTVVYASEQPPDAWEASLFIAGPMPRTTDVPSWRPASLKAVEAARSGTGELVVFVPEPRNGKPLTYDHHTWEDRWLAIVDVIAPPTAAHVGYLRECAARNGVPVAATIDDAAAAAMALIGNGSRRSGYDRQIPLPVWRHPEFRTWLAARCQAGHTLTGARVLWLQQNDDRTPARWVLNAQFENRDHVTTSNEFIAFGDLSQAR